MSASNSASTSRASSASSTRSGKSAGGDDTAPAAFAGSGITRPSRNSEPRANSPAVKPGPKKVVQKPGAKAVGAAAAAAADARSRSSSASSTASNRGKKKEIKLLELGDSDESLFDETFKMFQNKYAKKGDARLHMFIALNEFCKAKCGFTDKRCDGVLEAALLRLANGTAKESIDATTKLSRLTSKLPKDFASDFFQHVYKSVNDGLRTVNGISVNNDIVKVNGKSTEVPLDTYVDSIFEALPTRMTPYLSSNYTLTAAGLEFFKSMPTGTTLQKKLARMIANGDSVTDKLYEAAVYDILSANTTSEKIGDDKMISYVFRPGKLANLIKSLNLEGVKADGEGVSLKLSIIRGPLFKAIFDKKKDSVNIIEDPATYAFSILYSIERKIASVVKAAKKASKSTRDE